MRYLYEIEQTFRREVSLMVSDMGLLVFFVLLPLAYPVVYTLIYNPEVLHDIPVAVVDDCRTPASRSLVMKADAMPSFRLYDYAADMAEAKEWWAERKVYGVLHIPADYEKSICNGQQSHATLYSDMSLLLRYRTLLTGMTSLQIELGQEITSDKLASAGITEAGGLPVSTETHFLGDPQQGFASFVIPGIVVMILQQSMLLGIGLLGGTARERRRANGGIDPKGVEASASASVIGKTLAYMVFYVVPTLFILHYIPAMFELPRVGSPMDYLPFIFPMLLATALLGQTLVAIIKEREYVFLYLVFTSVIFLFLSGLTWPRYAMPRLWVWIGNLVPSTHGVEGFIRINNNGATLWENSEPYLWLWGLCAVYFVLAVIVEHYLLKEGKASAKASAQRSPSIAADTMPPA